jgi:S-adenosyl methyltransferase
MVSGSHLALSHITSDGTPPEVIATIHDAYRTASAPAVFRTRDQILQFFDGLHLIEPGLADLSEWHTSTIRREPRSARTPLPRRNRHQTMRHGLSRRTTNSKDPSPRLPPNRPAGADRLVTHLWHANDLVHSRARQTRRGCR